MRSAARVHACVTRLSLPPGRLSEVASDRSSSTSSVPFISGLHDLGERAVSGGTPSVGGFLVVDQMGQLLGLACQDVHQVAVDRAFQCQEAGQDTVFLANAVGATDGLEVGARDPVGFDQENVGGGGQGDAGASRLKLADEDPDVLVALEGSNREVLVLVAVATVDADGAKALEAFDQDIDGVVVPGKQDDLAARIVPEFLGNHLDCDSGFDDAGDAELGGQV